ncbi:hypothetical protein CONPUDRAFT_125015 [Coniophora puteana RWD-64-598 SS2]|uniref:BTB domain-containing protein n=1 Tax=Coniophora puteana (strain RWD-64-598) TaxID=741705 RepID=A0A5M3MMN4_CONPW|nr:uncharacterized protein CONPUDRAFT_125015 [Coniophora puteana RWD-64-598 SS2]EIW80287.1 hypothetical protein CONPUDRAFT_125015 [Coniophora puteana RWD-64-598 SS2]
MASLRVANAPFNASGADIVFRTSDDVDFKLHRVILAMASTVFKDMLGLPQPPSSNKSLPVVPVSESSSVLKPLLLFCYPTAPPDIDTLNDARLILDAAVKYDITCVQKAMAVHVSSQRFMEDNPVGVYCIACRYGWEQVARSAARHCLKISSLGRPSTFTEELRFTTAIAYHRLLAYHTECGKVACAVGRENLQWLEDPKFPNCSRCAHYLILNNRPVGRFHVPCWFRNALHALAGDLLERPDSTTVITSSRFEAQTENFHECNTCRQFTSVVGFSFLRKIFAQKVKEETGKVELEFEAD